MEYDGTLKDLCESLGVPWDSDVRRGDKSLLEVLFNSNYSDDTLRGIFGFLERIRWPPEDDAVDDCSARDRVPRPLKYAGYLECVLNQHFMVAMTEQKKGRWARGARQTGMQEPSDRALLLPTVAIHETLWNQGLTAADGLYEELFRCAFVETLMKSWQEHGSPRKAVEALKRQCFPGLVGDEDWWGDGNCLGGAGALVEPSTFEYIFTREIRSRILGGSADSSNLLLLTPSGRRLPRQPFVTSQRRLDDYGGVFAALGRRQDSQRQGLSRPDQAGGTRDEGNIHACRPKRTLEVQFSSSRGRKTTQTLQTWLSEDELKVPRSEHGQLYFTAQQDEQVLYWHRTGISIKAIARALNVGPTTIDRRLRRLDQGNIERC